MRIVSKHFCPNCRQMVELNVIGNCVNDVLPCVCSKCDFPIPITKDSVLPQWRKVLFGDTSRRIRNDNN